VWSALACDILAVTGIERFSLQILLTTSALTANLELGVMGVLCFDSLQYLIFPVNLCKSLLLLSAVEQPPSWSRPPHYRGFTITLRHTTLGRGPLDE
jgi:hypothetical protein